MGSAPAVCVEDIPESGGGNEPAVRVGDEAGPEPPATVSVPEGGAPGGGPSLGADDGPASGTLAVPGVSVGDPPAVGVAPGVLAAWETAVPDGAEEAVPPFPAPVFPRAAASSSERRGSLSRRDTVSCRVSEGPDSEPCPCLPDAD